MYATILSVISKANAVQQTIRSITSNIDLKESTKRSNEKISKNEINKKAIIMQRQQEQKNNKVQKVKYHRQFNK